MKGVGITADLERVVRQVKRIEQRLAQIEIEAAKLTSSEIAMLMARVQRAAATGRDLLGDMAKDVHRRIELARREYEEMSAKAKAR